MTNPSTQAQALTLAVPGNDLDAYMRAVNAVPVLSADDEQRLAEQYYYEQDLDAARNLVLAHLRFVVHIARSYTGYGLPLGDLVQEGNVGLLQAAERFEPDRGVRFSTYASWWIRSAMQDFILRNWSIVRTGTTAAQKSLFFNLRRLRAQIDDIGGEQLSEESREFIANELKVNVHEVEAMEIRLNGGDQSLNAPVSDESEDSWQDFLADHRPNSEETVVSVHDGRTRARWLVEALRELPQREQTIIRKRRLTENGATLEELGRVLGVSKERVRQLEHRALTKLRKSISQRTEEPGDLMIEA